MGVKQYASPLNDVFELELDERLAPALYEVYLGREHKVYVDSNEFLKRTHVSQSMRSILRDVVDVLSGRGGRNVHPLFSLFGGGKTHTLITIFHAIRAPHILASVDRELAADLAKVPSVKVVVLDCDSEELAPYPLRPLAEKFYKVYTVWGSLAHQLGRYDDLRAEDENSLAPSVDRLKRLLGDRTVVILIDEIVKYASRFIRSSDESLRNYGLSVITFVENLAKAVAESRTVVVLTLPIEVKEGRPGERAIIAEKAYEDVALSFHKAVGRVTSTFDMPLTVEDVVEVLKRRIFEKVDQGYASELRSRYLNNYSSEERFFGKDAVKEASKIGDSAPYHPSYVATLYDIVTKNPDLQKTRDALRITRKVVRSLWRSGEDPELIMPWHVDIRVAELRGLILTRQFSDFEPIIGRDLLDRAFKMSKPNLAYAIALSTFLKTYIYGRAIRPEKVFPTKEDIAVCAYEGSLFKKDGLKIPDIYDVLEELVSNLLYLQEKDGRYWFTPISSVVDIIEDEASRVSDAEAYGVLTDTSTKLLTRSPEQLRTGKGKVEPPTVLSLQHSQVFEDVRSPAIDSEHYILSVYLKSLKEPDDILSVLYTHQGRPRVHKNTVVALYPESDAYIRRLLDACKALIACRKVSNELDALFADKDIRDVQRKKLMEYERSTYGRLLNEVLTSLNKVAFPTFDQERGGDWYCKVGTKAAALSLSKLVEDTLTERDIGKISRDLSFDLLNFMFKSKLGIDLSEGQKEYPVSEIVGFFYTNTRLPFVAPSTVKEALKEGALSLDIGVRRGSGLYWKRVYKEGEEVPMKESGVSLDELQDSDIILPWKIAAKNFAELHSGAKVIADLAGKRRVWHVVRVEGREIAISDLAQQRDFELILKENPVIKREVRIEEDFDLVIKPSDHILARPGGVVEVELEVVPVGDVRGAAIISSEIGTVEPAKGELPLKSKWTFTAPGEGGSYTYKVSAEVQELKGKVVKRALTLVVVREPSVVEINSSDAVHYVGSELLALTTGDFNSFDAALAPLGGRVFVENGRVKLRAGEGEIELSSSRVEPEVLRQLANEALDYLGRAQASVVDFRASLRTIAPVKIDRVLASALGGLKDVKCLIRRGGGDV